MFGEGSTHGSPVSSNRIGRRQPRIGTTVNSQSRGRANRSPPHGIPSTTNRAISPIVSPWRTGTAPSPTNDSYPDWTVPPSIWTPPSGFGRSRTITDRPAFAAAPNASAIVHTYV
jgi:hypothetical protein